MPYILRGQSVLDPGDARRAIRARGVTIAQFSKLSGVSEKTIRAWLNGTRTCQVKSEWRILQTLRRMPVAIPNQVDDPLDPLPPTLGLPVEVRIQLAQEAHRQGRFPDQYFIPLLSVHPFQAWRELGYAVFMDARRAGGFREALEQGKPWLGRPDLFQRTPEPQLKAEWDSFAPSHYRLPVAGNKG